ncbi:MULTISPECIES: hypothetical protein [Nitrosomonas]|uniref:HNH endonuclease n=1 Tax=Nitrosomonas communis TaxID=44574 RepID=A0A0F7KEP1_9PROT|nr:MULTISPECIES: hypothetical protein [Nitrosomonas]AKH37292.1 hypothetical protein AAW31_04905 [Nitrosomonas communis]TYP84726.1 hypothetical protein BCL69_103836 [Nitrosomonas communis]UVS62503.1 hypothetical protein NX761_05105 [Nitrosomonas sp. PLL12]
MNCWICGDPAETGEHMIKASDLRYLFGHTTTKTPIYRRINTCPHELIQGVSSPKLKFRTRLCAHCNNARTQLYDKSWETFVSYLRNRSNPIQPGEVIRPVHAFQNGLRRGLLGIHLYFVKLTGCLILDAEVPIETESLANAILKSAAHPNIYLSFLAIKGRRFQNRAFVTPIQTMTVNGGLVSAQWFYFVGRIGVHITYATHVHLRSDKVHLWHPSSSTKTITLDEMNFSLAIAKSS